MYITMSRRATTIPAKYSNGKLSFSPGPEFPGWPPLFLRAPVVGNAVNDVNINIIDDVNKDLGKDINTTDDIQ